MNAVELNDLQDLSRLSAVLETCAKFDIRYLEDFDARAATIARRISSAARLQASDRGARLRRREQPHDS